MPRNFIRIDDGTGRLVPFALATDDKGMLAYSSHLLEPVHISVYSQSEEARYANLLPGVGSVYAQDELDGGLGKKTEVHHEDPQFNRYYYMDWLDGSVRGQVQKGPEVVTLSAPANSGPLSGFFTLAGVPYLVLGRRIASWASDALTAVHDYTVGIAGGTAAVFGKLGSPAADASQLVAGAVSTLTSSDDRLAQVVIPTGTGVWFLSDVGMTLTRTGAVTGDVRLSICADLNGTPGPTITSARMLAANIPTVATGETFRFDTQDTVALVYNQPIWLVLDAAGTTAALTMAWSRSTVAGNASYLSTDGGNSWGAALAGPMYFTVNAKQATTTAFIATSTAGQLYKTSTDGSTFTPDAYKLAQHFVVVADLLVRSIQSGATSGTLDWSTDGANWSQDPVVVGDPNVAITNLLPLAEALIVCKEDGVFAVDIAATPIDVQQLYAGNRVSTNGAGAAYWRGAVYVPFNGRLMAVEGDFTNGFTVHESVGIESLPEWDWPWGQGRHVACVGTRFHLYSLVSATGTYKLVKAANPLKKRADGIPDPDWHGSLANVGDGTQSVTMMAHYDPGGSSSPHLFMTTTGNDIARITLPRSFNPASDSLYRYDAVTPGELYFPYANGNYPVHPKSWVTESVVFHKKTANDYVETMYDDLNGEVWRRMPKGRLYDTGALPYPTGLASTLLARRLRLINSVDTASPLLSAFAVSYAVRHIPGAAMREITFSVVAEDGLSAADIGEILGIGADKQRALLGLAAGGGGGTRKMEDPYGRVYPRVQFLDATEVLQQAGRDSGGRSVIQVSAVAIGT